MRDGLRSVVLLACVCLTGCGEGGVGSVARDPETTARSTGTGPSAPATRRPEPSATTAADPSAPTSPPAAVPTPTPALAAPTDPQILSIAMAVNDADIEAAKLAKSRTGNPEVLAFADRVLTDHERANEEARALTGGATTIAPEDNEETRALKRAHALAMDQLKALEGASFDRGYLDNEVATHARWVDLVDRTLLPNAEDPRLAALLRELRPILGEHLGQARRLQGQLEGGFAPAAPGPS